MDSRCYAAGVLLSALLAVGACAPSAASPPLAATRVPPATAGEPAAPAVAATPGTAVQAPVRLNLPHSGRGVAGLAHYLAMEDGFYQRQGIEVESPNIGSPPTLMAALLSGDAPVAAAGQEVTLTAALGGAEVVLIASQLTGIASSIIAQRDIRGPQELRGKRMGVTAYASPTHTGAVLYLRGQGLEPGRDVAVTPIGGMPEIRGALESGALESAAITPPLSYALARAGFSELADLSTLDLKYHQGGFATTRTYARDTPDVVRRVLLAYAEAQRAVLDDRASAQRVLAKWVNVTDAEELDKTYELALRGFRHGPTVDPAAVQTSLDLLADTQPSAQSLPAARLIDNTFANEAAARHGFPTR